MREIKHKKCHDQDVFLILITQTIRNMKNDFVSSITVLFVFSIFFSILDLNLPELL